MSQIRPLNSESGPYVGGEFQGLVLAYQVEQGPKGPQARDVSIVTSV